MLRKCVLSTVAGLALLTPLAVAPAAQAKAPEAPRESHDRDHWRDHEHWHRRFEVMYRPCRDVSWNCYGSFHERWEAERAEHDLRAQGYEAFVRD